MAQTVIGFFENNLAAYKAVDGLTSRGISAGQIDITREEQTSSTDVELKRKEENGFTRFFKNLFGDSEEADRYSRVSQRGYTMVTVHARSADEASFAANQLDDFGALDVDEDVDLHHDRKNPEQDLDRDRHRQASSIQRSEEDVNMDKQRDNRDAKRMRSRIVEKPVEENIRLREERIRVERNPVDRAASEKDLQSFQEGNIELTERKEIPVVNKEARVVEEIRLHKEVEERDETVHEKIRRTEVDVDKLDRNEDDYANKTFDNRRTAGSSNNLNDDIDDKNTDYNRKSRRDGDPLFGA